MSELRYVTDEEQIAAIDHAVESGWSIRRIDIGPAADGVVTFSYVKRPENPASPPPESFAYTFPGYKTVTLEWGCGLAACWHAKDIMDS
jgi:hypothetical protein